TAVYSGSTDFNSSTGSLDQPQTVNKAHTTTTVTSSKNPSVFGESVTFTATVRSVARGAGTPRGTVQFKDNGTAIGTPVDLTDGTAIKSTSTLTVGDHTITAEYSGSTDFNFSIGSLDQPQTVNKAHTTTTVTSSKNPSIFGESVTFTATV